VLRRRGSDQRRTWLKSEYGITSEQYNVMYSAQNGQCAICGVSKIILDVDHDHTTNEVRGLLCRKCNGGIGLLCDSDVLLAKALQYLRGANESIS
jgi:hypothetical protein